MKQREKFASFRWLGLWPWILYQIGRLSVDVGLKAGVGLGNIESNEEKLGNAELGFLRENEDGDDEGGDKMLIAH